jgi:hypothetical protein
MAATQRVTSDKKDIPSHYVQLSSYGCNSRSRPATAAYQALHHAWSARKLGGWKLMSTPTDQRGPIFVDPAEAEQIVASSGTGQEIRSSAHGSDSDGNGGSSESGALLEAVSAFLGAITTNQATLIAAVERLAFAAEKIAEQPLARMDDIAICEPSSSSNGFHS